MHLTDGLAWAIPVVLGVTEERGASVRRRRRRGARCPPRAPTPSRVLRVSGTFKRDKQKEAVSVYRTDEAEHPGVAAVYDSGDYCLAGDLEVISLPAHDDFRSYRLDARRDPRRVRRLAGGRRSSGSRRATRSTAHTSTSRSARSRSSTACSCTRLMGATKSDDVPPDVRMRVLRGAVRGVLPEGPRDGGDLPRRDAVRGTRARRSGTRSAARTTAARTSSWVATTPGSARYYGTYDAQQIFNEFEPGELGITTLNFEHSFWCEACEGMASPKTCPSRRGDPHLAVGHEGSRDAAQRGTTAAGVLPTRGRRHPDRGDAGAGGLREARPRARLDTPISRLGRRLSLPRTASPSWSPASMI